MASEPFEIDPADLRERRESGEPPMVLDVREPWEIAIAALPDITAIPLGELQSRVGELPRDRPIAVMCHHGGRSAQATQWLRRQGFDRTMNVAGGIDAWSRLIDPAVPRY